MHARCISQQRERTLGAYTHINEQNLYERISNYCFKRAALNRVVCGKPIQVAATAADYNKIRGLITGVISHYGNRAGADDRAGNYILKRGCTTVCDGSRIDSRLFFFFAVIIL